MPTPMIEVEQLVKTFGKGDDAVKAVTGIDFSVPEGEIFGLLGANGAGKSTVVLMLATLLEPTSGNARVAGHDVVADPTRARLSFGAALQETGLDPLQKGGELLNLHARLYGYDKAGAERRTNELLDVVGLQDARERRIGSYSGGMRRRLDLAAALIHHPKILFLDEPTTGLDPASRRAIWDEVSSLRKEGVTVLLTTQYLEEADQLADHVAIMADGTIAASGTPDDLKAGMGADVVEVELADEETAARAAAAVGPEANVVGHEIRVNATDGPAVLAEVVGTLKTAGIEPQGVTLSQPTLDDVFLNLTDSRENAK
ncbi:MAG: ATP-binding cassette domain-containing protein [Actinomycetes bacterium]